MIGSLLRDEWRFLTFRRPRLDFATHRTAFLCFGLAFTWLAGVGRYWDNPRAETWQHLGLGSIAYVLVLAAIIWLLLAPLRPRNWSYLNVLTFIVLTAPPAILYALPVERFIPADSAATTNAVFLAVVAAWRVALFVVFLVRTTRLSVLSVIAGSMLPLVLIVVSLSVLNLEHVVFNLMVGNTEAEGSPNDLAYRVVLALAFLSLYATPVLALLYVVQVWRAWRGATNGAKDPAP